MTKLLLSLTFITIGFYYGAQFVVYALKVFENLRPYYFKPHKTRRLATCTGCLFIIFTICFTTAPTNIVYRSRSRMSITSRTQLRRKNELPSRSIDGKCGKMSSWRILRNDINFDGRQ